MNKKNPFKVGDIVEQIRNLYIGESPFAKVIRITQENSIEHQHLNKLDNISNTAHIEDFKLADLQKWKKWCENRGIAVKKSPINEEIIYDE